jgi:hemoglobin
MRKAIETILDVEFLVSTFYKKVMSDELLAPKFTNINFEHHLPRIVAFWNMVLLDGTGYTTNVFDKHVHLQIDERHFKQWLHYFHATVDEYFEGEKANLAKQRADVLGYTFQTKLAFLNKEKTNL